MRTVRAFAAEEKEVAKYAAAAVHARDLAERLAMAIGALNGMTIGALNGVGLLVLGMGGVFVVNGDMTTGPYPSPSRVLFRPYSTQPSQQKW